nr:RILP-like protein 1 [Salvelinus alpinus]
MEEFGSALEKNVADLTVMDVYDIAAVVGQEFERIIDQYGCEALSRLMPKVVRVLEILEVMVSRNSISPETEELRLELDKLRLDRMDRLEKEKKHKKVIISLYMIRLIICQVPGMSERERQVMKKLKEVVDKQRDEIRAKDRELTLRNEDVEALQQQQSRLMKINHDLRHKISVVEAQGKALIEQKVELEAGAQARVQEMGALSHRKVTRLRSACKGDTPSGSRGGLLPSPLPPQQVITTSPQPPPHTGNNNISHPLTQVIHNISPAPSLTQVITNISQPLPHTVITTSPQPPSSTGNNNISQPPPSHRYNTKNVSPSQPGSPCSSEVGAQGVGWPEPDRHYHPELMLGGYDPAPRLPSLDDDDEDVEEEAVLLWEAMCDEDTPALFQHFTKEALCDEEGGGLDQKDPNRPRFTLQELRDVLHERNELKSKVFMLQEEIAYYKSEEAEDETGTPTPSPSPEQLRARPRPNAQPESGIKRLFSFFSRDKRRNSQRNAQFEDSFSSWAGKDEVYTEQAQEALQHI